MTRLSAQALLDRALECSRAGQNDEALANYAQLMQHFPGESVAHYNRGCLYERLGKLDLALADFREAYRLDPDEEDYRHNLAAGHFNRGLRYHKQGNDDLALSDFREACRLNPDEPDYRQALATASYNRGIDYAKGGDDARALAAFEEALRINPANADYRHNVAATRHSLGVRHFKKQDYEHAKAEFQEAVRLCPKNKVYRQCLAATEHNLRLAARTRDGEADSVPLGREQRSALNDEDTNPRMKRPLAAVPVRSSWPGQPAGYSNPEEKPIFSGDGHCPKCQALLWIDWKLSYDTMACPGCRFEFDGEAALSIVTSHEPGQNSGDFGRVREAIRMKKEAVIQQVRSEQQPQLPATTGRPVVNLPPPPLPQHLPGQPSRQSVIAAMTGSGSGQRSAQPAPGSPQLPVKKREPGLWHRVRSLFQPNTDKCPNCQESLAGEYVGEETIAHRERLETRPMPILDARGHFVGEQLQQVVVEDVVWWRYLRCKFCGHEWREKRSDTFQL